MTKPTTRSRAAGSVEALPAGYRLVETCPLGGAPGTYTYAIRPALAAGALEGRRVLVPFGSRRHAAIVLGVGRLPDNGSEIREVEELLDEGPLISAELLAFARWAADYYAAPLALALKAVLPPGSDVEETRIPRLSPAGIAALKQGSVGTTDRRALRAIEVGEAQLLRPGTLSRLVKEGLLLLERKIAPGADVPMQELAVLVSTSEAPRFTKAQASQAQLYERLRSSGPTPIEDLRHEQSEAREILNRLVKRGLARIDEIPRGAALVPWKQEEIPTPTEEQAVALTELEEELAAERPRPVLLEGVTGSGKTEVYLRLIARAREQGGGALVLVPEIALTPQLARRFRARFGNEVAVLHSGLGERDRAAEWHRVQRGEAPIVVGARSAVFAPIHRPRVIIVDEEHDGSFKQDNGLRYQGRDLAIVRAARTGALVVLGSATPSLESIHNVNRARYRHVRLTRRIDGRELPRVELVDLRGREKQKATLGILPSGLVSPELRVALTETLARGEQAIVFLNRRGHSTTLLCRDCGAVKQCAQCSVAMTWHERRKRLECHYCGQKEIGPDTCPDCGSARLLLLGAGTEKLEEEVAAAAPGARIGRLDRDTAGTARQLEEVLRQFGAHELDVLVGTQMLAKGHDFPGVTLVCVLLADAGLNQPDFRSSERTAQLLTQVAGRAGRGERPGRVLVQTFSPETPAVAAVVGHDYASFARDELKERLSATYPPFTRLALLRFEGPDEAVTAAVAREATARVKADAPADVTVLGPAPAPLAMLRGRFRFQTLIKGERPTQIRTALARWRSGDERQVRVALDIDPADML